MMSNCYICFHHHFYIPNNSSYDYIIAGAGCAGLSLLMRMLRHSFFAGKKILLIDADDKQKNDRTWCFWETQPGFFEEIVYKQWEHIEFYGKNFSARFDIAPYRYKMIRGGDLYRFAFEAVHAASNVVFVQQKVEAVYYKGDSGFVQTATDLFFAPFVFNSLVFNPAVWQKKGSLLQHFKGWIIDTNKARFNSDVATMMDFRIQPVQENAFVYVLPLSPQKALVEYTVFSPQLLDAHAYDTGLKQYIADYLQLGTYDITAEEFGVIPMSTFAPAIFPSPVVHIGTAGGQTKSSSGYTFQFIQKHSDRIVEALLCGRHPVTTSRFADKRFQLYDNTLLHILYNRKMTAEQIFSDLFRHNKPQQIFRFLDNETSMQEELKIMTTVPARYFLPAALHQLLSRI